MSDLTTSACLTPSELADKIRVSLRTLYRMHDGGEIPAPAISRKRMKRWLAEEIEAWLQAGGPRREVWELQRSNLRSGVAAPRRGKAGQS